MKSISSYSFLDSSRSNPPTLPHQCFVHDLRIDTENINFKTFFEQKGIQGSLKLLLNNTDFAFDDPSKLEASLKGDAPSDIDASFEQETANAGFSKISTSEAYIFHVQSTSKNVPADTAHYSLYLHESPSDSARVNTKENFIKIPLGAKVTEMAKMHDHEDSIETARPINNSTEGAILAIVTDYNSDDNKHVAKSTSSSGETRSTHINDASVPEPLRMIDCKNEISDLTTIDYLSITLDLKPKDESPPHQSSKAAATGIINFPKVATDGLAKIDTKYVAAASQLNVSQQVRDNSKIPALKDDRTITFGSKNVGLMSITFGIPNLPPNTVLFSEDLQLTNVQRTIPKLLQHFTPVQTLGGLIHPKTTDNRKSNRQNLALTLESADRNQKSITSKLSAPLLPVSTLPLDEMVVVPFIPTSASIKLADPSVSVVVQSEMDFDADIVGPVLTLTPLSSTTAQNGIDPPPSPPPTLISQIKHAIIGDGAPITELRLAPDELGSIHIELSADGDRIAVRISADRHETLDLLRRHGDRLVAELRSEGFQRLDLSFNDRNPDRGRSDIFTEAPPDDDTQSIPVDTLQPSLTNSSHDLALYLRL